MIMSRKFVALPLALLVFGGMANAHEEYKPVDISTWKPATSAMALLEPIYKGHPETLEGRPKLKIKIRKDGDKLVAIVVQTGFLDDSLKGSKHRAEIIQADGGWKLTKLGVAYKCWRGTEKGWTTKKCS